jgi:hypothetical protein
LYANFASKGYLKNAAVAIRLQRLVGPLLGTEKNAAAPVWMTRFRFAATPPGQIAFPGFVLNTCLFLRQLNLAKLFALVLS